MNFSYEDDLKLASELADLADSISLPRFIAQDFKVETKPDSTPVTEADRAVEEAIKNAEAEIWRKTDPAAKARAADVVKQLSDSIANYEKIAAKSQSVGNDKKAKEALDSAEARKVWLAEAEKSLAEFN